MKKVRTILIIVLLLAVAGMGIYIWFENKSAPRDLPAGETIDIQGIVQDIAELDTAKYVFTITHTCEVPNKKIIGVEIPFTSGKAIYSYNGYVKAGIEFDKVQIIVNEAQKKIFIQIPKAEITDTYLDPESLIVYNEKFSFVNGLTLEAVNSSQAAAEADARATAIENGLLEDAEENAKNIIRSTVASFYDISTYEIVFH